MAVGPGVLEREQESGARSGMTALVLFSTAHFFIDLYSAALGALQPLLVQKLALSLTEAGVLGGVLIFSSSVMQPAYGYLSDRFHTRMFTALAPAVAGIFITAVCIAPGYAWLLPMVLLGGAGIASFHPQASARAAAGFRENRGRWFAVFISAGTLGMALGPTFFSTIATRWGFERIIWASIPGILMTLLLLAVLPEWQPPAERRRFDWAGLRAFWKPLTILYFLVFIRSVLQVTFAQLLPLYLSRERGFSYSHANYSLSLYLTCGAVGGFLGGHLSDRFGGRAVILWSMLGSTPLLAVFFFTDGWLALAGLALGGLVLLFTIPVNVVMAQELAPKQAGTISALMMGFAWGMAGLIFIPLTGWLADRSSMHTALSGLLVFPLIGAWLAVQLPRTR